MKNKIIMLTCVFIYCNNVFSSQGKAIGKELSFDVYDTSCTELERNIGYWTTKEDLHSNKWFYKTTEKEHQREDWYKYTRYIAETSCTLSNAPFLLVAYQFMDKKPVASAALAFAGTVSAVSHAIPRHWLNVVDRIGAVAAPVAVAYDCNLFDPTTLLNYMTNPSTAAWFMCTIVIKCLDYAYAHSENLESYRKYMQASIHNTWHLTAIATAYVFLLYATRN